MPPSSCAQPLLRVFSIQVSVALVLPVLIVLVDAANPFQLVLKCDVLPL